MIVRLAASNPTCSVTAGLRVAAWIALSLAAPGLALADVIDQSYLPDPGSGYGYNLSAPTNLPLGQSFTPTLPSLDFVDLLVGDASKPPGTSATIEVEIRSATIAGPVLGTSTAVVPAGTDPAGIGSTLTHFSFASPIALTPGSTYVIDAFQTGTIGATNGNFLLYGGPLQASTYPGGTAILSGTPAPGFDFTFREGVSSVPEPSSLALAGLGLAGLGLTGLRRRVAQVA